MQYALVDGTRCLPSPRLEGSCPSCGERAIAKCGQQKLWHWAHSAKEHCDPWWENETEWHINWKAQFPVDRREVVHVDASSGEKHIADVKTRRGLVIELQHSTMSSEEMQSREAFYDRMIWVVDGMPFSKQFTLLTETLPSPSAEISKDIRFVKENPNIFWRISDGDSFRTLFEMHSRKEIEDEIQRTYEGHHFYKWKYRKRIWLEAKAPVFIDFGGDELLRLKTYGESRLHCVQKVEKRRLVEKNGGTYVG
jgi:hypothetical protein